MSAPNKEMMRYATAAVFHGVFLSLQCVVSFWLITHLLAQGFSVSRDDDLLGGM